MENPSLKQATHKNERVGMFKADNFKLSSTILIREPSNPSFSLQLRPVPAHPPAKARSLKCYGFGCSKGLQIFSFGGEQEEFGWRYLESGGLYRAFSDL